MPRHPPTRRRRRLVPASALAGSVLTALVTGLAIAAAPVGTACSSGRGGGDLPASPDVADADMPAPDSPDGDATPEAAEPRSVTPYVRLLASGVEGILPRETEIAIATVRDSAPETGWQMPAEAESQVEIDLLPWAGRPVPLHDLALAWTGDAPGAAVVTLAPGCGLPGSDLPWDDLAKPLDLADASAGCVTLRLVTPGSTRITVVDLRSRDGGLPTGEEGPELTRGSSLLQHSGVIEGFYGVPWSWRERHHLVEAAALQGLDTYLYAPKNDPLHRARWREPYPQADLDAFSALARRARTLGISFLFGVSPFIDFDFTTDADTSILLGKLRTLVEGGVHGVAVLGDDIEMEIDVVPDGALGQRHAALVNRILADLRAVDPDVIVWFTPTVYSDERANSRDWPNAKEYLQALAALDASVEIQWTGVGTGNVEMKAADMDDFRAQVGRKPLIWDNFWANDGGDGLFGRILLKPYSGRAADLPGAVRGVAQNLSIQGALSRLSLATFGRWAEDPATATRENEIERALEAEQRFCLGVGRDAERDAATLRFLIDAHDGMGAHDFTFYRALDEAAGEFLAGLDGPGVPVAAAARLLPVLGRMAASQSELHHSGLDADLVDDAWYPAWALRTGADAALLALALAGERMAGRDGAAAAAALDEALLTFGGNRFLYSPGTIDGLSQAAIGVPRKDRGFQAVAPTGDLPACTALEPWTARPFAGGDLAVFGLPGATASGGDVTWTPPRAGRFRAVMVAWTDQGWGSRIQDIVCAAPRGP